MEKKQKRLTDLGGNIISQIEGVALWRTFRVWLEREFNFEDPTFYDLFDNYTAEIHSFLKTRGVKIEAETDPFTGYYQLRALFPPRTIDERLEERKGPKRSFSDEFEDRRRRSLEEEEEDPMTVPFTETVTK